LSPEQLLADLAVAVDDHEFEVDGRFAEAAATAVQLLDGEG
jgi:hypothetical protein